MAVPDFPDEERRMLVVSRKINESIIIGGNIRVTMAAIRGRQVRLAIEAPPEVHILRQELVASPEPVVPDRGRIPDRPVRVLRNGVRRPGVARAGR
jgi:carbon storage regulator CsrA